MAQLPIRSSFPAASAGRLAALALLLALLLAWLPPAMAATPAIPPDRLVPWDPGVRGGIPALTVKADVRDFGAVGDGAADDGPAFNAAIQAAEAPGYVWVPPGVYRIATIVQLKSGIALKGAGHDQSRLLFDLPGFDYRGGIELSGTAAAEDIAVLAGYEFGSTELLLESAAGIQTGDLLWLYQDNDEEVMFTAEYWNVPYAADSMSQLVGVAAVSGAAITLDMPLRLDYQAALNPRLRIVHPIEAAGIEDVYLERLDTANAYTVSFRYARNSWMRGVESQMTYRAHIWAFYSRFLTVTGNYFHRAHDYGGGGHGYGVTLADSTSDCLVTNNVFHLLRHAMMVKEGANGNVFSYNYSFENIPGKADVSMHGHYNYANLFEGNVVEQIVFSDWWGPSGPFSTAFRNRVNDPVGISVRDHSHYANVVGNTTPRIDIRKGRDLIILGYPIYMGEVEHELVEDNFIPAQRAGPGAELPASLYLDGPPGFWGDRPWPSIGADVDQQNDPYLRIPAQEQIRDGVWRPPSF